MLYCKKKYGGGKVCAGGEWSFVLLQTLISVLLFCSSASGIVGSGDVLILVNGNSPTSRYIAKLYREYHPGISDLQVLVLTDPNLQDCSGATSTAADEIISRDTYERAIAAPVRSYLISNGMVNSIKVIITTGGLPYRIEDTSFTNIVMPGGGIVYSASLISSVDAAAVESELTILFQNDSASPYTLDNWDRTVNPYQGYRNSGINLFTRDIIGNLSHLNWRYPRKLSVSHYPPLMEGDTRTTQGVKGRHFSAGDIYLTCRLDGPKNQGQSAIFAVRKMLELSMRASNPSYGINQANAAVVLDDAPLASDYNYNRIYNLDKNVQFIIYQNDTQQPPDTYNAETRDDYQNGFKQMTGQTANYGILNTGTMSPGHNLTVFCDMRNSHRTNQADLSSEKLVVAASSFGVNGDEGNSRTYILTGGPSGSPLFNLAYGSVFFSIESYSAATMFSDVSTGQGKIIDFLQVGGCGSIGHVFEPYSDASINTEFFYYNLLSDSDSDGFADLTFIEAAFTAIPYLSWAEIVLGDPLMRIAYGPGGPAELPDPWDTDRDGQAGTIKDLAIWTESYLSSLYSTGDDFEKYNDICDFNHDGSVNLVDFAYFTQH